MKEDRSRTVCMPGMRVAKKNRQSLLRGQRDLQMTEGDGGTGPKVTGKDMMGSDGREIKGNRAMEGFKGQSKEFVLDAGVQQKTKRKSL